jgi:hypothetical protein
MLCNVPNVPVTREQGHFCDIKVWGGSSDGLTNQKKFMFDRQFLSPYIASV